MTNDLGKVIRSMAVTNIRQAYGLDLEWLRDENGDGWPDRWLKKSK